MTPLRHGALCELYAEDLEMKRLVVAAAVLVLSATAASAFPQSFGLPHFVQVDDWPGNGGPARRETGSIGKTPCDMAKRHCAERDGKQNRSWQMPLK